MSLLHLSLRDFVIVHTLDIGLQRGFTVLTGETGAGKSILIDALQLVLGGRADASMVREGASRCDLSAEFDPPADAQAWLDEQGFPPNDGGPLLLRRSIDSQGRSRAWINGVTATASQLRMLAEQLVDIHGQHAWVGLTRPDTVRQLLDDYGRIDTRAVQARWATWREAEQRLAQAHERQTTLQQERERLQWQIAELDKLAPGEGEWDDLNLQQGRLAHAQGLVEAAQSALAALQGDEPNACGLLHRAAQALRAQQHIEPRYTALADTLDSALALAEDACHDLQAHADGEAVDPAALQALDERLALWLSLSRRHRCQPTELPLRLREWRAALQDLEASADLDGLQAARDQAFKQLQEEARQVSRLRQQAARQLSQAITEAMQGLGMAGGRFEVALLPLDSPQAHGLEQVEFRVAGHAGSTPRPVGKVASGGELSRIALAIAVTTSQLGRTPTLIFDEVDSGIGGTVAQTVGQLMRRLGRDRQVLAVTHLPQVAACADHHLQVSKQSGAQGTLSDVRVMDTDARVHELARMLGGGPASAVSLAHARELLQP